MYNRSITRLDEGIDVYGDWIDACVAANAEAAKEAQIKLEKASPQNTHNAAGGGALGGTASHKGPHPSGAHEQSEDETRGREAARHKRARRETSLGGPSRLSAKKRSKYADSESSSEEAEGAPKGSPERRGGPLGEGSSVRRRLKVDRDREETASGAAESGDSDTEGQRDGERERDRESERDRERDKEVGGVLENYRKEAEGEEEAEEEDDALFHDDE